MLKTIIQGPIRFYRWAVSPLLGSSCRFYPTCSAYALKAIDRHGAAKGLALATRRILRCHPWCHHDHVDPVPERFDWRDLIGYKRKQSQNNDISST
ncbi:MAG: membrane protein insertion efficiency factor YidD [Alphaproteobacteria bacterium]|nr:membrane protein insertion efficiency factor YidD [Alphaproteobacteria bacterium]